MPIQRTKKLNRKLADKKETFNSLYTMSDNETKVTQEAPKTQWGPILKDMFILVCVMATLGYLCKLAMVPFEHTSPTDSLVSIIRKGAITQGKDDTFLKEMELGAKKVTDFINYADNTGRTPLMWAAYCNFNNADEALNKDIARLYYVRQLLATPGINTKQTDRDGFTALHWAAWSGMPYTAVLLLDSGIDINATDHKGYTPLMLAALRGNDQVVRVLLSLGADASKVNADGKNAAQLAAEKERAYSKRDARIFAWTHIPGLENFNLFELIYAASRETAYQGTIALLSSPPAVTEIDVLKQEMAAAEAKAAAVQAKAEAASAENGKTQE